jgi:hypothetical protein
VIQNAGGDGAFVERLLTKIEKDKIKKTRKFLSQS